MVHIYENYVWLKDGDVYMVSGYISFRIAMYYQLFQAIFIWNFAHMLKRRYDFLDKLTTVALNTLGTGTRIISQPSLKLKQIRTMYFTLYNIVNQLNR
ncbi:hypothetical protein NQ318_016708 [Aromia moschata]|uniref:Uncharacterized protein n=1 Tax=Aromia moschata TaxID=1265417 RepID=A0AAV8XGP5_9CUCU|nr:hypothetical protein NQ318_016708 [Aromia moschata]